MRVLPKAGWLLAAAIGSTPVLPICGTGRLAAQQVVIEEWEVPWEGSRPRDPYVAPDGGVWFVESFMASYQESSIVSSSR